MTRISQLPNQYDGYTPHEDTAQDSQAGVSQEQRAETRPKVAAGEIIVTNALQYIGDDQWRQEAERQDGQRHSDIQPDNKLFVAPGMTPILHEDLFGRFV